MAVCGSPGRRSSLENRIPALSASNAQSGPNESPKYTLGGPGRPQQLSSSSPSSKTKTKTAAAAQAKAAANKPHSNTDVTSQHQPKLRREPYRPNPAHTAPAAPARPPRQVHPSPRRSLTAPTTVSATTVSATTGGCPTIGAPHPEHTRAVTATSAAHSPHLICTHPAADAQNDTTPAVNRHGSSRQARRAGPRHLRDPTPSLNTTPTRQSAQASWSRFVQTLGSPDHESPGSPDHPNRANADGISRFGHAQIERSGRIWPGRNDTATSTRWSDL